MTKKSPVKMLTAVVVALAVVLAGMVALFVLLPHAAMENEIAPGSLVRFGPYTWIVLDMQEDRMLLLSEHIIALRAFYESNWEDNPWDRQDWDRWEADGVTWETSSMRTWLNTEFLDQFDQSRVLQTAVVNHANSVHATGGGAITQDHVFLLSLDEVLRYFGDSGQQSNRWGEIWDRYNRARRAYIHDFTVVERGWGWTFDENADRLPMEIAWWLRTLGIGERSVAFVAQRGYIRVDGVYALDADWVGVRPAMWVSVEE